MQIEAKAWAIAACFNNWGQWSIWPWSVRGTRREVIAWFSGQDKAYWHRSRRAGLVKAVKVRVVAEAPN